MTPFPTLAIGAEMNIVTERYGQFFTCLYLASPRRGLLIREMPALKKTYVAAVSYPTLPESNVDKALVFPTMSSTASMEYFLSARMSTLRSVDLFDRNISKDSLFWMLF